MNEEQELSESAPCADGQHRSGSRCRGQPTSRGVASIKQENVENVKSAQDVERRQEQNVIKQEPGTSSSAGAIKQAPQPVDNGQVVEEEQQEQKTTEEKSPDNEDGVDDDTDAATCAICCDEMSDETKVSKPQSCDHPFHYECLLAWITSGTNDRCPFCRIPVTKLWNPGKQCFESFARKNEDSFRGDRASGLPADFYDPYAHVLCFMCGTPGNDETLMLCGDDTSACERACHAGCLGMDSVPDGVWTCPACAGLSMPSTITRDWVTRLVSFVSEGAQLDDPGSGAVDARRERLGRVVLQLQHIRNRRVQFALRVDLLHALGRWVRPGASTGEEAIRVAILTQLTAIFDHVDFRLAKQSKVGAALVRCMNAPEEENSPRSRHLEDGILGKIQRLATKSLTQRPQLPAILVNHIRALSRARERGNGPQSRVKLAYGNAAGELDRTQASLPSTMKTLSSRDWSARDTKRLLLYGNGKEEVPAREDASKRPRVSLRASSVTAPSASSASSSSSSAHAETSVPPQEERAHSASSRSRIVHAAVSAALDAVIERDVQNVAELNLSKRAKVRELALKEFMNDGAHRDAFEAVIAVRSSVFDIDERKEPEVFVASILGKSSDQVSLNMKRIIQFVAWDV